MIQKVIIYGSLLLLIYATFIERYMLFVHQHKLSIRKSLGDDPVIIKIAVFGDQHLGLYKGNGFLKRIVQKVNEQNPDLVLIPGDFLYLLKAGKLKDSHKILSHLKAPAYGVLGNHDQKAKGKKGPGEFSLEQMYDALGDHIQMIDNQIVDIEIKGKKICLVGIGSLWAENSKTDILKEHKKENTMIVLMHNPDSVMDFPSYKADLAIAGHTHGGQIRIPFIYKFFLPTDYGFDKDWYNIKGMPLFITAGTGEVILPMRFLIPPRIDVIELTID